MVTKLGPVKSWELTLLHLRQEVARTLPCWGLHVGLPALGTGRKERLWYFISQPELTKTPVSIPLRKEE